MWTVQQSKVGNNFLRLWIQCDNLSWKIRCKQLSLLLLCIYVVLRAMEQTHPRIVRMLYGRTRKVQKVLCMDQYSERENKRERGLITSALQYLLYVSTDKVTGKYLHIYWIFALKTLRVDCGLLKFKAICKIS